MYCIHCMLRRALYILTFIMVSVSLFAAAGSSEKYSTVVMHFQIHYPIDSITMFSSSSPDGPFATNQRLARERGQNATRYLLYPDYFTRVYTAPYLPVIDSLPDYEWPEIEEDTCVVGKKQTKTLFALKSNLLYDLAAILNFSVEVPLYKEKVSVLYYHQTPWWRWGEAKNEYCMRFLSIGAEARWWFAPKLSEASEKRIRRDKLTGHFVGVYGESGKYDFEHKKDICYQGEFWSAGLSYGYSMPIGKRLNMEFSISAGYASIAYRGYTPSDDYETLWRDPEKVGKWHYFGPTKAQVSLVIPITAKLK